MKAEISKAVIDFLKGLRDGSVVEVIIVPLKGDRLDTFGVVSNVNHEEHNVSFAISVNPVGKRMSHIDIAIIEIPGTEDLLAYKMPLASVREEDGIIIEGCISW